MPKSIKLKLRVWYDHRSKHIKMAGEELTASAASDDPKSKRYNPNLYAKLARRLRAAGVPAPNGAWDKFFDAPGVDLTERKQPEAEAREPF